MRAIEPLELARRAAAILQEMKGREILLLDVAERLGLTDYFLLVSAPTRRQVQAMASELNRQVKLLGHPKGRVEGAQAGWWILVDLGEVVVHIFRDEARSYYDFDLLWADAPRVDWALPEQQQAV